jgi:hypothetical protein
MRRGLLASERYRHPNHSSAATQRAAKTANPLIMVNISSSRSDIGHLRYPAARSSGYEFFAVLTVGRTE